MFKKKPGRATARASRETTITAAADSGRDAALTKQFLIERFCSGPFEGPFLLEKLDAEMAK
jgi:hypothetical protein